MSNTEKLKIVAESEAMKAVLCEVQKVALTKMPVLLTGETGVGKEVIAHKIHEGSSRKTIEIVDCTKFSTESSTENFMTSELFGHMRGAFTGAVTARDGKFKLVDGGTLFLDEVGTMSLEAQSKLLRVLQEQTFQPLGGNKNITVDVRIIAATSADLEKLVGTGEFSDALYYRLDRYCIDIPPLRDRPDDIKPLIPHMISKLKKEYQIINEHTTDITPDALEDLKERYWGGNVRELENTIGKALVRSTTNEIQLEDLPPEKQPVGLPEGVKMEPDRNPVEEELKRKFKDTKNKLNKLREEGKLPSVKEESDIQYLAAVILKKSEPGQSWKRFGEICEVSTDTCQRKQTQWRKVGTIESADRLLKECPPLDG